MLDADLRRMRAMDSAKEQGRNENSNFYLSNFYLIFSFLYYFISIFISVFIN